MKFMKTLISASVLAAAMGAQAQVVGSLGAATGDFLTLSAAGLAGGSVATLSGGALFTEDKSFADVPAGSVFGGNFLAAGVTAGPTATLTFAGTGVSYVSFLWGSPDAYNRLTVNTTKGSQNFSTSSLGFSVSDGRQSFSQPVSFTSLVGSTITSLVFTNTPNQDAFEVANFSLGTVTPVPEPETYAMVLAGFFAVLFLSRRRKAD